MAFGVSEARQSRTRNSSSDILRQSVGKARYQHSPPGLSPIRECSAAHRRRIAMFAPCLREGNAASIRSCSRKATGGTAAMLVSGTAPLEPALHVTDRNRHHLRCRSRRPAGRGSRSLSRSNLTSVISHWSSRALDHRAVDIATVRAQLAVDYCLELLCNRIRHDAEPAGCSVSANYCRRARRSDAAS